MTLHEALIEVRRRAQTGDLLDSDEGICSNVLHEFWSRELPVHQAVVAYEKLEAAITQWPENSGIDGYPVKHPEMSSEDAYNADNEIVPMWAGPYGEARLRPLDFLIERTAPGAGQ